MLSYVVPDAAWMRKRKKIETEKKDKDWEKTALKVFEMIYFRRV